MPGTLSKFGLGLYSLAIVLSVTRAAATSARAATMPPASVAATTPPSPAPSSVVVPAASANGAPPSSATAASTAVRTNAVAALKEIGHTRARTTFCEVTLERAAHATSVALENDSALAAVSDRLRHSELDENAMGKPKMTYDLQRAYESLMARTKDAVSEFKALRELAAQAPTPEQRLAIVGYADAVGGALHRQELVAGDFIRFGAYLQAHDPVSWQQRDRDLVVAAVTPQQPGDMGRVDPRDRVAESLDERARGEATHLDERHENAVDDEVRAASTIDAAFGPCGE